MKLQIPEIKAFLELEDGSRFEGKLIGFPESKAGEVVFNTGMVGYPEALTDPSYKGQILTVSYPLVGNYGVPAKKITGGIDINFESEKIHAHGLVISDYSFDYSHHSAVQSLSTWLYDNHIPGIYDIDTRMMTKILREKGSMLGRIIVENNSVDFSDPNKENLVAQVCPEKTEVYGDGNKTVILIDCGCKTSILTDLLKRGVKVKRVPFNFNFIGEEFDGVLISNGPGDPAVYRNIVDSVKHLLTLGKPVMGICLGHQILSLAAGAKSFKMKYGHRSQNQPVQDNINKRCFITSQNHGYAVDVNELPKDWINWFSNLNDGTNEGIRHKSLPYMSVQFHPEACPGPVDTAYIFDEFINLMK
ncbi:MAG: glutamine-hydrolyzing carbamoyl-phosphate synthase small subunit [Ignavibacteria bacterium]|nr:glutamine-hydrolyzing carbamoyl-phosphate synthase small subunit [Ignavibacteria bacterium]